MTTNIALILTTFFWVLPVCAQEPGRELDWLSTDHAMDGANQTKREKVEPQAPSHTRVRELLYIIFALEFKKGNVRIAEREDSEKVWEARNELRKLFEGKTLAQIVADLTPGEIKVYDWEKKDFTVVPHKNIASLVLWGMSHAARDGMQGRRIFLQGKDDQISAFPIANASHEMLLKNLTAIADTFIDKSDVDTATLKVVSPEGKPDPVSLFTFIPKENKYLPQAHPAKTAAFSEGGKHADNQARQRLPREYSEASIAQPIQFNYLHQLNHPGKDSLSIKLGIGDPKILEKKDRIFAAVTYINAEDSSKQKVVHRSVTFDEKNNANFTIEKLDPKSVYRMKIELFNGDTNHWQQAKPLGEIDGVYAITSGDSKIAQARHQIATTALLENEAWKRGKRNSSFYGDCKGGWCGMFPLWCARRQARVFDECPDESYSRWGRLLGRDSILSNIRDKAVHGDWGWKGSHKFMILAHDRATGSFHTVEGNFDNRVQMSERTVGEISQYGQLLPAMVWDVPGTPQ